MVIDLAKVWSGKMYRKLINEDASSFISFDDDRLSYYAGICSRVGAVVFSLKDNDVHVLPKDVDLDQVKSDMDVMLMFVVDELASETFTSGAIYFESESFLKVNETLLNMEKIPITQSNDKTSGYTERVYGVFES